MKSVIFVPKMLTKVLWEFSLWVNYPINCWLYQLPLVDCAPVNNHDRTIPPRLELQFM